MNYIEGFLEALRRIAIKFGKDDLGTDVLDQERVTPGPILLSARQTKGQSQEADSDKELIKNIDRVMPFLRKKVATLDSEKSE